MEYDFITAYDLTKNPEYGGYYVFIGPGENITGTQELITTQAMVEAYALKKGIMQIEWCDEDEYDELVSRFESDWARFLGTGH